MNRFGKLISATFFVLFVTTVGLRAGEIHNTAASGDLEKVKALLEANPSLLESKDDKGNTPLISACWGPPAINPQVEIANFLIDKGADIYAKNDMGATPLYFGFKDSDLAQRLIAMEADVSQTPKHRQMKLGISITEILVELRAVFNE